MSKSPTRKILFNEDLKKCNVVSAAKRVATASYQLIDEIIAK
jgi:hypothetical protein